MIQEYYVIKFDERYWHGGYLGYAYSSIVGSAKFSSKQNAEEFLHEHSFEMQKYDIKNAKIVKIRETIEEIDEN